MTPYRKFKKPPIITIGGTKGKTTIARLLSYLYTKNKRYTLLVDTDGHYVNDKIKSTLQDSLELYGLVPTNCPGRYLYELKNKSNSIAILETAVSCYRLGLGYNQHKYVIFTNLLEDHIGLRIKNRQELARKKAEYLFGSITPKGTIIFNADDKYVTSNLGAIPKNYTSTLLPVGLTFKHFDLKKHLNQGGKAITIQNHQIVTKTKKGATNIIDTRDVYWTFGGYFKPSLYNLMFTIATLYAENSFKKIDNQTIENIKQYKLSKSGGRLTLLKNKQKNLKVLLDFAHEKYSLREVARLAKQLSTNRTIGIIRLAPERTDNLLKVTGKFIANEFDTIIIYDKLDDTRKEYKSVRFNIHRKKGDTSKIVFDAIEKEQKEDREVHQIISEEEAIKHAFSIAKKGDCLVHIVNDDHKQSIAHIKKYLNK
jgi:UDP-N-acetylmuramyl tripeptide synthase